MTDTAAPQPADGMLLHKNGATFEELKARAGLGCFELISGKEGIERDFRLNSSHIQLAPGIGLNHPGFEVNF